MIIILLAIFAAMCLSSALGGFITKVKEMK